MQTLKRTYALPPETVIRFEEVVESGQRSAIVATLLDQWIKEKEREALQQRIIESCADMADEYQEIEREFLAIDEELHRALGE
jgi:oligoendopeptidase F